MSIWNLPKGYKLLEKVVKDVYTPNFMKGKGPYLAKVLRVTQVQGPDQDFSFVDAMENNYNLYKKAAAGGENPFESVNKLKIRARITSKYLASQPNIHGMLEDPEKIGNEGDTTIPFADEVRIAMHPEFISINEIAASQVPSPGDFIWVDFLDKENRRQPVYLYPYKGGGMASAPPCGQPASPSSAFNQAGAKGAPAGSSTNSTNNPARLKGMPINTKMPSGKKYTLHGYVAGNFTKSRKFLNTQPYRANLEKMVAGVEIMHWYLEQLYPGKKIEVYDPKAGTGYGHSGKSSHKWGSAIDFKAKIGGKKLDHTTAWCVLFRLIVANKIPDGGVGFYQTNSGRRNIATTYKTNLKPSGCPHWDYKTGPHPKSPKKGGYPVRKWYWGTKDNATVQKYGPSKAASLLKKPRGVPRYAVQRYNELPTPDPNMPTWEQVIEIREKLAQNPKPAASAEVKNNNTSSPPPAAPAADDKNKKDVESKPPVGSEPQKEEKKKQEAQAAEAQSEKKKADEKAKAPTSEKKASTDAKKADASKKSQPVAANPTPSTTTAINNCANPGGAAQSGGGSRIQSSGGGGGGATGQPPKTGKVNQSSQVNVKMNGQPKGMYQKGVYTNIFKNNRACKNISMFICHESASVTTSFSIAKQFTRKVEAGASVHGTAKHVHFWTGHAGDIAHCVPLNRHTWGANWGAFIQLGNEVCNKANIAGPSVRTSKTKKQKKQGKTYVRHNRFYEGNTAGYKVLGPSGNVGGSCQVKGKGNGTLGGNKLGFYKYSGGNYTLPTEIQCRRNWELIVWLSDKSSKRPFKSALKIPILFPCVINDKKLGTGFASSISGAFFVWGRFNPMVDNFKTKPEKGSGGYQAMWRGKLPSGPRFKAVHHWQRGIVAHHRWYHTDGVFQEFYCLARARGMNSKEAYFAAIGGAAASNKKSAPKGLTIKTNFTRLPDQRFVKFGKKVWGANGSINWTIRGSSYLKSDGSQGKAKPGKSWYKLFE